MNSINNEKTPLMLLPQEAITSALITKFTVFLHMLLLRHRTSSTEYMYLKTDNNTALLCLTVYNVACGPRLFWILHHALVLFSCHFSSVINLVLIHFIAGLKVCIIVIGLCIYCIFNFIVFF